MLDAMVKKKALSLSETSHLRAEAMRLFKEYLTSDDETALFAFIEHQIMLDPPPFGLLHQIAGDIQQHLLSLRENHFDTCIRVISTLSEDYQIDITSVLSPDDITRYHHLHAHDVVLLINQQITNIHDDERPIIDELVAISLQTARQLDRDIQMTTRFQTMLLDWLEGISSLAIRSRWPNHQSEPPVHTITQH